MDAGVKKNVEKSFLTERLWSILLTSLKKTIPRGLAGLDMKVEQGSTSLLVAEVCECEVTYSWTKTKPIMRSLFKDTWEHSIKSRQGSASRQGNTNTVHFLLLTDVEWQWILDRAPFKLLTLVF